MVYETEFKPTNRHVGNFGKEKDTERERERHRERGKDREREQEREAEGKDQGVSIGDEKKAVHFVNMNATHSSQLCCHTETSTLT